LVEYKSIFTIAIYGKEAGHKGQGNLALKGTSRNDGGGASTYECIHKTKNTNGADNVSDIMVAPLSSSRLMRVQASARVDDDNESEGPVIVHVLTDEAPFRCVIVKKNNNESVSLASCRFCLPRKRKDRSWYDESGPMNDDSAKRSVVTGTTRLAVKVSTRGKSSSLHHQTFPTNCRTGLPCIGVLE
jgi:hypothetical protein